MDNLKKGTYKWHNSDPTRAHKHFMQSICAFLPRQEHLKIADLGCGNGYIAGLLASLGHTVTGLDDSEDGIRIARATHPSARFLRLSLYDDKILQEAGNGYDVVISSEVIEHLYYPRVLLQKAYKMLKPDGMLILTTVYHGYLKNLALALSGKTDRHFCAKWDGGHIKFFSVETLTALVQEEGFSDIRFKFAGRLPFLWKSMILCAKRARPEARNEG